MGLLGRVFGNSHSPTPALTTLASRSYVFPDISAAQSFQSSVQSFRSSGGNTDLMAYLQANRYADQHGGILYRSSTGRERLVYGYQSIIYKQDREYLLDRDPTAGMFIESPWAKMWNGLPTTYDPTIDAFLSEQLRLGLLTAFQAAYQEHYQEGGAFIYCETTGDRTERVRRGERPLRWTFVPASHVIDTDKGENGYILAPTDNKDPLIPHGFEFVSFYPTTIDAERRTPIQVHGSRLIPINLNPRQQKWWRSSHIPFNRIYDTLWELRDILFSHVRAQFQGDPIVVEVDLSDDAQKVLAWEQMDDAKRTKMAADSEAAIRAFNAGAKSTFAPVMGLKMKRLGPASLPDSKQVVSSLSARLSHGTPYPVKMILASTQGNVDVADQDLLIYQGNLQDQRNTWGYMHLSQAVLIGQVMGANGLRMDDALPPPLELEWPLVRPLSPRDAAFTQKTDIAIYNTAWQIGRQPPPRILRKFPLDPSSPLAPWLAGKGRLPDGTSADPIPSTSAPPDTTPQANASAIADAVAETISTIIEDAVDSDAAVQPVQIKEA
jgi:hypothetical protein